MALSEKETSAQQGTHAQFQSTHWSIVLQAADTSLPVAQDALSKLCQAYWFPLYAFIRGEGNNSHRAKDLTQGFFLHLLENKLIKRAEPEKGRFRSFLLACLTNFMKDEWRRENALKRGGKAVTFSIDEDKAEEKYGNLPVREADPTKRFDRAWATTVIEQATQNLKQIYAAKGKLHLYQALKPCLTGGLPLDSYPKVAANLGMSRETFQVNLSRFKDAFGKTVRSEIGKIVANPADIDAEIKYLMSTWADHLEALTHSDKR